MIEKASGVVLRTRPLTETSLIIHWLTPDLGRLSTVAKGARRHKSPFRGKLDLFYLADFSFTRSRRSELHSLREVSLRETHQPLRQQFMYFSQASYCAALIEQTTETETPLAGMYQLMTGFLANLPKHQPRPQMLFAFELRLLHELGMNPDLEQAHLTPGAKKVAKVLSEGDWDNTFRITLSPVQVTELQQFLHGFLIFHLGRIPASRTAALQS